MVSRVRPLRLVPRAPHIVAAPAVVGAVGIATGAQRVVRKAAAAAV